MSIFPIISRKQRPEPKRVRIFLGGTGQICLHFHSNWNENKCVTAIQLAVSRCPPDICILSFKSVEQNHNHRPCRWYALAPLGHALG